MADTSAPPLKEIFNHARHRAIARELREVHARFDERAFLKIVGSGI